LKARGPAGTSWSSPTPTPGSKPPSKPSLWVRRGSAAGCTAQHFVLARGPKGNAEMVAAAIRTVVAQPYADHVHAQLDVIAAMLGRQFPPVRRRPMLAELRTSSGLCG
jgi:putative transposase